LRSPDLFSAGPRSAEEDIRHLVVTGMVFTGTGSNSRVRLPPFREGALWLRVVDSHHGLSPYEGAEMTTSPTRTDTTEAMNCTDVVNEEPPDP
jgi:hypothetical protein